MLGTLLENFLGTLLGSLLGNPVETVEMPVGTLLETLLGTLFGNPVWEPCLGTLFGNPVWEPCLGTLFGNPAWEPCLGTLFGNPLETLMGALYKLSKTVSIQEKLIFGTPCPPRPLRTFSIRKPYRKLCGEPYS